MGSPESEKIGFVDPHFHLWDLREGTASGHDRAVLSPAKLPELYLKEAYEEEMRSLSEHFTFEGGVFIEAVSVCHIDSSGVGYSKHCLAEAELAVEQLGSASNYVIVPTCALEQGDAAEMLGKLSAMPRIRGVRQIVNSKPDWPRNARLGDLLDIPQWQQGFAALGPLGLSFDLQLNPHQFSKAAGILSAHPEVRVIIDHLGSPRLEDLATEQYWTGLAELASCPNTFIKISMLCYADPGWDQTAVVEAVHRVIRLFGPSRCMFATNSPVDKPEGWPPRRVLDAFRAISQSYSREEVRELFSGTARRAYGIA